MTLGGALTQSQGREIANEVNKVPQAKRPAALKAVRKQVKKAQVQKLGDKLSTKDVKSIAKSAAATAAKTTKTAAPRKPKAPTTAEKAAATKFQKAIDQITSKLRSIGSASGNVTTGPRFAQVLLTAQPATAETVKELADYFKRVHSFIAEAKRQKLVAQVR